MNIATIFLYIIVTLPNNSLEYYRVQEPSFQSCIDAATAAQTTTYIIDRTNAPKTSSVVIFCGGELDRLASEKWKEFGAWSRPEKQRR